MAGALLEPLDVRARDTPDLVEVGTAEIVTYPAVVQVRVRNYVRLERSEAKENAAVRYAADGAPIVRHGDPLAIESAGRRSKRVDLDVANPDMAARERARRRQRHRGRVTGWSPKSRRRFRLKFGKVDWSQAIEEPTRYLDAITLTAPGGMPDGEGDGPADLRFVKLVAPTGKAWADAMNRFRVDLWRTWGPVRGLGKRENQWRDAPHVHILAGIPTREERNDDGLSFREWLGPAWARALWGPVLAELLGRNWARETSTLEQVKALEAFMPRAGRAYLLHIEAGTRVGLRNGAKRISDPKRAATYFLKDTGGASSSKAYQDRPPSWWTEENGGTGRVWMAWGLPEVRSTVAVPIRDAIRAGRTLRRWHRAQLRAAYARAIERGERPRRYRVLFANCRGSVLVNDGPALLSQIARAVMVQDVGEEWRDPLIWARERRRERQRGRVGGAEGVDSAVRGGAGAV